MPTWSKDVWESPVKLQCNYTATANQGGIILYGGHGCLKINSQINKHSFCTRLGLRDGPCMHFLEKMRKMVGTTQHLTNKDFAWGLVPKATIYAVLDGDAPVCIEETWNALWVHLNYLPVSSYETCGWANS